MTFRPAERDREILSFDEPRFAQPLTERCDHGGGLIPSPIDQNPCAHWRKPMDMMRQG